MKLSSKKKKAATQYMTIAIVILAIISIALCVTLKLKNDSFKALRKEANANTQVVYVATREIEAGETIYDAKSAPTEAAANVEIQNVYTGLSADLYMTDAQIGQSARLPMAAGVPVLSVMVTDASEISKDAREVEVMVAELMTDQADGDYVDVRIAFADGTDEIVLAKKKISHLILGSSTWQTQLNEQEIITLTSAIIDAYVTKDGTRVYTTRYTEPTIQDPAIVTYTPSATAIDLINSDPNVVEKATTALNLQARLALEERLARVDEQYAQMVGAGYAQNSQMDGENVDDENMDEDEDNGGVVNDMIDDTIGLTDANR